MLAFFVPLDAHPASAQINTANPLRLIVRFLIDPITFQRIEHLRRRQRVIGSYTHGRRTLSADISFFLALCAISPILTRTSDKVPPARPMGIKLFHPAPLSAVNAPNRTPFTNRQKINFHSPHSPRLAIRGTPDYAKHPPRPSSPHPALASSPTFSGVASRRAFPAAPKHPTAATLATSPQP
jgi:hypothetical protein